MPYKVEWLEEPYIVEIKMYGDFDAGDSQAVVDGWIAAVEEAPRSVYVHTLFDVSEIESMPAFTVLAQNVRRALARVSNRGPSTIYGLSRLTRYLLELLLHFTTIRMRAFDTREDALQFIYEMIEYEKQAAASE